MMESKLNYSLIINIVLAIVLGGVTFFTTK